MFRSIGDGQEGEVVTIRMKPAPGGEGKDMMSSGTVNIRNKKKSPPLSNNIKRKISNLKVMIQEERDEQSNITCVHLCTAASFSIIDF